MGVSAGLFRLHRKVLSPDAGGLPLAVVRALLRVGAAGYGLAAAGRNALYRRGLRTARRVGVPIISVGNITAGGTGKTPLVAWLARLLAIHNRRPAILSRGYGRHPGLHVDDENALLGRLARDIPIVVDADRVRGAQTAIRDHGADVLILDDGFQHRRIARDLDLVLIDAVLPFGGGHLLPRGLLREPLSGLARADALLLTRVDLVDGERLEAIREELAALAPHAVVACCRNQVRSLRPLGDDAATPSAPEDLRHGRWGAFCGIGNPEAFELRLRKAGCQLAFLRIYSDHERYSARDLADVLSRARDARCDAIVTTEKDATKIERLLEGRPDPPIYALGVETEFTEGSGELTAAMLEAVGCPA